MIVRDRIVIDRFEDEYAICEFLDEPHGFGKIPKDRQEEGCKEGDVIQLDTADLLYKTSKTETENRKNKMRNKLNSLK